MHITLSDKPYKQDDRNSIFLLGGHDLEMITIKALLLRYHYRVEDCNLSWNNALLSAYQDVITAAGAGSTIYGIELKDNLRLPDSRYIRIDHHDDFSRKDSSLEQVSRIIGHTLTREEQLIAANDKAYIPAMEAMGASPAQIEDIRRRDRSAQGVTEQDEALAEQSIRHYSAQCGAVLIVKSLTGRFSAICDRLYPYRRLLIYTPFEWTFYGEGKKDLAAELAPDIVSGRVYHGGGDSGYIGAAQGAFTSDEINTFVSHIKSRYEHA